MLRFTIRDVLWLTVVVALGVAWWLHSRAQYQSQAELKEKLEILTYEKEFMRLIQHERTGRW